MLVPLSKEQEEAVDRVWGSRRKMFDWRWFELYNWEHPEVGNEIWKFIPVDYWLTYIDPVFTQPIPASVFDDKNMYNRYFPDVKQPKTIARVIDGLIMDEEYHVIGEEEVVERCKARGKVVVKPSIGTCGGSGIQFWDRQKDDVEGLKRMLYSRHADIVQEVVTQHPVMAALNESSCNTIRLLSLIYHDEIKVIPKGFVRFGGKGEVVDNVSSGGFCAAVNEEGEITGIARNHHEERKEVPHATIPNYRKCIEIAQRNTQLMASVTKLVAWDFAIGEDGEPVLLEVNLGRTSIQSLQALQGPILGDYIDYFLEKAPEYEGSKNWLSRCFMDLLSKMDE